VEAIDIMFVIEGKSEEGIKSESTVCKIHISIETNQAWFYVRVPVTGLDKKVFKTL